MKNINVFEHLKSDETVLPFIAANTLPEASVSDYKNFRKQQLNLLKRFFHSQENIYETLSLNTCIIDELLKKIWNMHDLPNDSVALVAIGGYGRRELFPFSDIDLMIVLDKNTSQQTKSKVESFLTFLWDINLAIAQSVRTISNCINEAKNDITVMTSLMETYYLCGNKSLFNEVKLVIDSDKFWPSKKFLEGKSKELSNRHHKYGDTGNHLEPNIKENPGSLRDLHTLSWITNRHFKTNSFEELIEKEFLTHGELTLIQEAYKTLASIRFALHLHTLRGEDRLLFDFQHEVASLLGFHNENRNQRVEEFMQVFYRTNNQIATLSEILIKRMQPIVFPALLKRRARMINENFQSRGKQLEAAHANIFKQTPSAIFELFHLFQLNPKLTGPSDELVKLLLSHLHTIDNDFRNDPVNNNLFISILNRAETNSRELRRMAQLGVLGRYWPSFDAVTGRMQFDLFHIYTVEEHTLRVFENTCQFSTPSRNEELNTYHDIFTQTPKSIVLYLAALFHDIAKGRGGDHADLGEQEAKSFCLKHNLSSYDSNLVAWLVKNHLTMSVTSQNQDLSDPNVIKIFSESVGNLTRLNYLYLLTIADIQGTNPKLWNSWRSSLLAELYQETSRFLRRDLEQPLNLKELIRQVKSSALDNLQELNFDKQDCLAFWKELSDDYFRRHSDEEVTRHTAAILNHKNDGDVVVNIHQYHARGATEIFIYCNDRNYLFAHITSTLSRLGLSIVHARIITSAKGHALDTFLVLDANGHPIKDKNQCLLVEDELIKILSNPEENIVATIQSLPRRIRELRVPIEIQFDLNKTSNHTVLELKAPDFPGLLASLGNAFVDCSIAIHNARISKLGERVHNLFQISNLDYKPLSEEHQQKLKEVILQYLKQPKQTALKI